MEGPAKILPASQIWRIPILIFVTVGTHTQGFDRLLREVERLIGEGVIREEVFAQIGYSRFRPSTYAYTDFVGIDTFKELVRKSNLVITHGGEGAIVHAFMYARPVIVVPRMAAFGEHTNDHQLQLTSRLERDGRIIAVYDIEKLHDAVERARALSPQKMKNGRMEVVRLIEQFLQSKGR